MISVINFNTAKLSKVAALMKPDNSSLWEKITRIRLFHSP